MSDLAALLLTALYYPLLLPVYGLFRGLVFAVSPFYYTLHFVLLPFAYLAHFAWRIAAFPFAMLAKLEVCLASAAAAPFALADCAIRLFMFTWASPALLVSRPAAFSTSASAC